MIKLEDWMTKPVITINPDKSVLEAVKLMSKKDIGALIVEDEKMKLKGIFTERDVLKMVAQGKDLNKIKVKDVMIKKVRTVDVNSTVLSVSKIMHEHGFRRIPVTKKGQVVGIMTDKNLIELMSG
jgi:CBS domain-containing protein